MYTYDDIAFMYNGGYFTNEDLEIFVPSCISEDEKEKMIAEKPKA